MIKSHKYKKLHLLFFILDCELQRKNIINGIDEEKHKGYEDMIYRMSLTLDEFLEMFDIKYHESSTNFCLRRK